MKRKILLVAAILSLVPALILSSCTCGGRSAPVPAPTPAPAPSPFPRPTPPTPIPTPTPAPAPTPGWQAPRSEASIGLAAGGAKDIENFRQNIANGYLPLPTDITYEGLFYDYYFDTGAANPCDQLFCPAYSYAVTRDPFSGRQEYYLAVGLNSGMKQSDFERKKLNLVIVLDRSGSMDNPFDTYYYDQFGEPYYNDDSEEDYSRTKFEIATEAVANVFGQLGYGDRIGLVTFNERANTELPLIPVEKLDMRELAGHVLDLAPGGSTNLSSGIDLATDLFSDAEEASPSEYENRIIFLTDAMPNTGETGANSLLSMAEANAARGIYTTFIGIGVDFNTELTDYITKIRGANYYSVHSGREFRERLNDEFDYMVTPLVFDLKLKLQAQGWDIEKVYGSPEADEATGELMKVNTLFPSERVGGEAKGGLILIKLRKSFLPLGDSLKLAVSYEDRQGWRGGSEAYVQMPDGGDEYFANDSIRKGVLLARYADLMKDWLIDERGHVQYSAPWDPCVNDEDGIIVPPELGQWERQSLSLNVSYGYEELFRYFGDYFESEMAKIGDPDLQQELRVLHVLRGY